MFYTHYCGTHTHVHKNSDFLVVSISMGLAQVRPKYYLTFLKGHNYNNINGG